MTTAPWSTEPTPPVQENGTEASVASDLYLRKTANPMMSPLYHQPGTADAVAATFDNLEDHAMYMAFLALYRGRIREVEHTAERMLEREIHYEARVGCGILLSTCALYLGSRRDWARAQSLFASLERQRPNSSALKISKCTLNTSLYIGDAPEWLQKGRFDGLSRHGHTIACFFYTKMLLVQKNYSGVLAVAEPMIASAHLDGELMAELYLRLIAAAAYRQTGDEASVAEHVEAALELALPDGLYAPLAEFRIQIGKALDGALKRRDPLALQRVRGLYRQLAVGFTRLRNAATGGRLNPEMTLQEFEIACMARQGLRNAEIAERLNVTESSVKKYFYALYQKLGISKRSDLEKYVF